MAEYKIYFKESVEKDFRTIPKKDLKKSFHALRSLQKIQDLQVMRNLPARRNIVFAKVNTGLSIPYKLRHLRSGW